MNQNDRKETVARTLEEIRQRCFPLLVGFGGSIAYGTDLPGSDIDIRGIYLNPPEEWIGLQDDSEQLKLDDSDTVVYSLKKAMKLLLSCNPSVIELLGLRPEHVLYCTPEGRRILEQPEIFLSKKAIFSFNGYAVKQRRRVAALVEQGNAGAAELSKNMMHLIRIYAMGTELLETGRVVTYREREHDLLMKIRNGAYLDKKRKAPTTEYERLLEDHIGAFNSAAIRTHFPPEPDYAAANALTMEIVRQHL